MFQERLPTPDEWRAFSDRQSRSLGAADWAFHIFVATTNFAETLQSGGRLKAALAALALAPGPEEMNFGPAYLPGVGRPLAAGGWDAL